MAVLGSTVIRRRMGDIFASNGEVSCIREASYELRVARDLLLVDRKFFGVGDPNPNRSYRIEPGDLALLTTMETFHMPQDLVGSLGIKFKFTRKGLTPLFGFQVEPYYGKEISTRGRIEQEAFAMREPARVGFMNVVRNESIKATAAPLRRRIDNLETRVNTVAEGINQIVLFGVFLVAATIFATSLAAMFAMIFAIDAGEHSFLGESFTTSAVRTLLFVGANVLAGALILLILVALFRTTRIWLRSDAAGASLPPDANE